MGKRRRGAMAVTLAVTAAVVGVVGALAANPATAQGHWPGPVDLFRRYPWPVVAVVGVVGVVLAFVQARLSQSQPGTDDPPPPAISMVPDWVVERPEVSQVVAVVCSQDGGPVGITTGLHGAGGFGKTAIAVQACAAQRVRRHFRDRVYMVTVGRGVNSRAAIAAKVAEVTRFITGDTASFEDPDLAGAHLGRLLDQRPRTLLVLDDVWGNEQLAPFLMGGRRCVRLITTRVPGLLPADAFRVKIDRMPKAQARQVLTRQVPNLPEAVVRDLLEASGHWPLLLRLINRLIVTLVSTGAGPGAAAAEVLMRVRAGGPAGVDDMSLPLDLDDSRQRNKAIRASVQAAVELLPAGGSDRFAELGIFAEGEAVPISVVALLWQATAGLLEADVRRLCRAMSELSLITVVADNEGQVRLHEVMRDHLRRYLSPEGLTRINAVFVGAVAKSLPRDDSLTNDHPNPPTAWWSLTSQYLMDHVVEHMRDAGHVTQAEALAGDLRWVQARLYQRGPTAAWSDLAAIPTPAAAARARDLARAAHLLQPTEPGRALAAILSSRLLPLRAWQEQTGALHTSLPLPALVNAWPPPDLPDPALIRTLTGAAVPESVAISPDGTWIAIAGDDGSVQLRDRATGVVTTTLTGHTDEATAVAISPDGTWLATASRDTSVRLWDRATGKLTAILDGHTNSVTAVAISPDGTWLATAGYDATVRIWDFSVKAVTRILKGGSAPVFTVAISPDGTWLATGQHGGLVRIWDRATGEHTATVTAYHGAIAISPDGAWLATDSGEGSVQILDAGAYNSTATIPGEHLASVSGISFSPDGSWLAVADRGNSVRIWDIAAIGTSLAERSTSLAAVAISPDGTWLATGAEDGSVRIWDRATKNLITTLTGHVWTVGTVAISPDGTWLATGAKDGSVRIWDRATERPIAILSGDDWVEKVVISPDGAKLFSAYRSGLVQVWDRTTEVVTATRTEYLDPMVTVAISEDGGWLAVGAHDGWVRLWDRVSRATIATLNGHTGWVYAVAISPDSAWLATSSRSGPIRLWSRASGKIIATLNGNPGWVHSIAISPDGAWLATASFEGTIQIWDITTRNQLATLMRTDGRLSSCAWTPDGHGLAVAGSKGLYLYDFLHDVKIERPSREEIPLSPP
jgi:WD40 repeat protein